MESKNTPAPIPDRYRRVTPSLIVNDAAKALEFYGDVFGATERMRFPGPVGLSPTPRSRSATRSSWSRTSPGTAGPSSPTSRTCPRTR